jgi:REP element-mobilizing transposase RayT
MNLEPPPGFRGLQPHIPLRMYRQRLPHWRQPGATYFVTFRLADSIPQEQLVALKRWRAIWEQQHPEPRSEDDWRELAKEITNRTERWLDEDHGECVFKHYELAEEMAKSLLHFQDDRCFTSCYAVMGNHVHAVMKPLDDHELEDLLGSMKQFIANKVNNHLKREGVLWEPESYDRIVRDEEHLYNVIQYIGNNPKKVGLPPDQWHRWLHPKWSKLGWHFQE